MSALKLEFDSDSMRELSYTYEYIRKVISEEPVVIYFGVGSNFYPNETNLYEFEDWGFKNNQQFPPFLQDFKQKYPEIKILLILIDPAFN